MRSRITKLIAGLAVVSALGFGGATLASAASKAPVSPPGVEQTSESSSSELGVESSSESAISDGPGGHADDPSNASLDYQFQGEQ